MAKQPIPPWPWKRDEWREYQAWLRRRRAGGKKHESLDRPVTIHALPLDDPARVVTTTSEARRVMEERRLYTHPAQDGGIVSPLGYAKETPKKAAVPTQLREALARFRERRGKG